MSAEDRAALPLPPELFDALIRVIRETVRAEMRAEFEGREAARQAKERQYADRLRQQAGMQNGNLSAAQGEAIRRSVYDVPETIAGVPV